ncbi:MAG TPA: ABC transporter permease [Puia sp.]|nr:ABC transporter permease [Puia sp.]
MLQNYLRTAIRNLLRARTYSIINILGLALGLAAFIGISAYVKYESTFDRMLVSDSERVYRVESAFYRGSQMTDNWATSTNGYAPAIKDRFPEIADYTRISWTNSERVIRYENTQHREAHVCFADSNFFSFFRYRWLKGDRNTALKEVNSIVLSASAAHKYFGDTDPIGKLLEVTTIATHYSCRVTGVFADPPPNSTMQFSMLLSWPTSPLWQQKTWYLHESYTFVKLMPGARPQAIEAGFPAMAEGYKNGPALKELRWAIHLVPFQDIHLNTAKQYEVEVKGNRRAVHFLNVLSYVILLIACVNYINLSTSKAMERAKEVGVRKVSGARPYQLIVQFLLESLLLNLVALSLAMTLGLALRLALPLTDFAGWPLPVWKIIGVFLIFCFSSSIYPALVLTRFQPITVLKGRYSFSKNGTLLRKGLVFFQFAVSLILIAGTLAVYRQIRFMDSQRPGVEVQQTVVLRAPVAAPGYDAKAIAMKSALRTLPGVTGVTGSGAIPGKEVGEFLANRRFGASQSEERTYEMLKVDFDFIPVYHPEIIAGRAFDLSHPTDSVGLVLNESAVRQLGFASPEAAIGQQVWLEVNPNRTDHVIGVIKDYHQQSLQKTYTPLILFMDPAYAWIPTQYFSVKLDTKDLTSTVARLQQTWNGFFPESPFDYFFLDEFYDRQYHDDRQFAKVVALFSGLAIGIAVLGLFGLTVYAAARRNREIGVRKVLGASVGQIMGLLTWDFVRLILLATLPALPLAGWLIRQWLFGYAFRAPMSWGLLLAPVPMLAAFTLTATAWLTFRAARANPARSLKEE